MSKPTRSHHYWTTPEEEELQQIFHNRSNKDLATHFGVTISSLKKKALLLELSKSKEYLSQVYGKPNAGQFKKGNIPPNALQDGVIRTRRTHGVKYKVIRIASGKWEPLQHYNWRMAGMPPIPEGHVLACKTKDVLDCNPSNWEIKRREDTRVIDYATRKKPVRKKSQGRPKRKISKTFITRRQFQKEQLKAEKARHSRRKQHKRKKHNEKKIQNIEAQWAAQREQFKKREKQKTFQIKTVDYSTKIPVRVDKKTIIYINPGEDPQQVIDKWLARKTA